MAQEVRAMASIRPRESAARSERARVRRVARARMAASVEGMASHIRVEVEGHVRRGDVDQRRQRDAVPVSRAMSVARHSREGVMEFVMASSKKEGGSVSLASAGGVFGQRRGDVA